MIDFSLISAAISLKIIKNFSWILPSKFKKNLNERTISTQLNTRFKGFVTFYQILKSKPILIDHGDKSQTDEIILNRISRIQPTLQTDDPHGILIEPINLKSNPVTFHFEKLRYSQIIALREQGEKPPLITANVVAIDPDSRKIILHHRSPRSHVYPDCLSIPGGGYWPPEGDYPNGCSGHEDGLDIVETVKREFREEIKLDIEINNDTMMILTQEDDTGAIQVNFLGAKTKVITPIHSRNWEGDTQIIDFDELFSELTSRKWTPFGKLCLLTWLAFDAPGTRNCKFSGIKAHELFKKYIEENSQEL